MFRRLALVVVLLIRTAVAVAQPGDATLQAQLQRLFPAATSFSSKESGPPHFKAFGKGRDGQATQLGVAFWSTEVEPLERGYDGPIKMLIGLTMTGTLAGVLVVEHHEPYGYFSVDRPEFAAQFAGKDIRAPFKIGADIDTVSRASITMASATRAIKNSSRRVARQLLKPPEPEKQ